METCEGMKGEDAATKAVYKVFSKYMEPLDVDNDVVVAASLVFVEICRDREKPFGSVAECTAHLEDTLPDFVEDAAETELAEEIAEGMEGMEIVYGSKKELSIFDTPLCVGDACLAVLAEDSEWHEAKVEEVLGDGKYRVVFAEFGKPQEVKSDEIVSEDAVEMEGDEDTKGDCPMCKRTMPLTRHHVVPRTTWPRLRKKGWADKDLVNTVDICRPCHSAVHRAEDEYSLAKDWNTLEKLMTHPELIKWMKWAATQKTLTKADSLAKLRHKR